MSITPFAQTCITTMCYPIQNSHMSIVTYLSPLKDLGSLLKMTSYSKVYFTVLGITFCSLTLGFPLSISSRKQTWRTPCLPLSPYTLFLNTPAQLLAEWLILISLFSSCASRVTSPSRPVLANPSVSHGSLPHVTCLAHYFHYGSSLLCPELPLIYWISYTFRT